MFSKSFPPDHWAAGRERLFSPPYSLQLSCGVLADLTPLNPSVTWLSDLTNCTCAETMWRNIPPSPPPSAHNLDSTERALFVLPLPSGCQCGVTHLSQCALHWTQEVGLLQAVQAAAVDVVQLKAQTLHLFKIKVQREHLGVGGVDTAVNHLGAVHLQNTKRTDKTHNRHREVHLRAMTSLPAQPDRLTPGFRRCLGLIFIWKEHHQKQEVKVVTSNCPLSVLWQKNGTS